MAKVMCVNCGAIYDVSLNENSPQNPAPKTTKRKYTKRHSPKTQLNAAGLIKGEKKNTGKRSRKSAWPERVDKLILRDYKSCPIDKLRQKIGTMFGFWKTVQQIRSRAHYIGAVPHKKGPRRFEKSLGTSTSEQEEEEELPEEEEEEPQETDDYYGNEEEEE